MTSQTRHYIDLADVLGLQFVCKGCGTSVDVRLEKLAQLPTNCPNCPRLWMAKPRGGDMQDRGADFHLLLTDFLARFQSIRAVMNSEVGPIRDFCLTLEIAGPNPIKVP